MRQRIALRGATIVGARFIPAGKRYRLEGEESNLLGIVEGELDDASDLLVVDAVHNRDYRNNLNSGLVEVLDRLQLHIEQISNFAVCVSGVADAIELQIGVTHSGFGGLLRK